MPIRQHRHAHTAAMVALACALVCLSGCRTETIEGRRGELDFSYGASEPRARRATPTMARGSSIELHVRFRRGDRERPALQSVRSSNREVLEVDRLQGNAFMVRALEKGTATIRVVAKGESGEVRRDTFRMDVAPVVRAEAEPVCVFGDEDVPIGFLTDHYVLFSMDLFLEDEIQPIGSGYAPFTSEPTSAITELHPFGGSLGALFFARTGTSATEQRAYLVPQPSGTKIPFTLVEPSSIDGIELRRSRELLVPAGTTTPTVVPRSGDLRICQAAVEMRAESLTPEICEVEVREAEREREQRQRQAERGAEEAAAGRKPNKREEAQRDLAKMGILGASLELDAVSVGTCRIRVELPAANGGDGVVEAFEIPVNEREEEPSRKNKKKSAATD